MDVTWVRKAIEQARERGTAVFVKQMGTVWAREHHQRGARVVIQGSGSQTGAFANILIQPHLLYRMRLERKCIHEETESTKK